MWVRLEISVTLMLVNVFSLMIISYDRFMCVAYPLRRKMPVARAVIIIAIIWVTAALFATPLIIKHTYQVPSIYLFATLQLVASRPITETLSQQKETTSR